MLKSNFIKQLEFDINKQKKIQTNPKLFINNRKIKLFSFNKNITENELPTQSLLGNIFLIKGSNILEFYSWCNYEHSLYLQINKKQPLWIGEVSIINIEPKDPENVKYLLEGSDIFYLPSNWQYFILHFLQSGFQLYIHK